MSELNKIGVPEIPRQDQEVVVRKVERKIEQPQSRTDHQPDVQAVDLVPPPNQTPVIIATQPPTDKILRNIESTMAEGLSDAYQSMDQTAQLYFKQTGEATALAIQKILQQSKIQVKRIVELLLRWLRLLPRVNPYYLEQQAKIKANAIVTLQHPPRSGNEFT